MNTANCALVEAQFGPVLHEALILRRIVLFLARRLELVLNDVWLMLFNALGADSMVSVTIDWALVVIVV